MGLTSLAAFKRDGTDGHEMGVHRLGRRIQVAQSWPPHLDNGLGHRSPQSLRLGPRRNHVHSLSVGWSEQNCDIRWPVFFSQIKETSWKKTDRPDAPNLTRHHSSLDPAKLVQRSGERPISTASIICGRRTTRMHDIEGRQSKGREHLLVPAFAGRDE